MPDSIIIAYMIGFVVTAAYILMYSMERIEGRAGVEMKVSAAWLFLLLSAAAWPLIAGVTFLIGLLKAVLNIVYVLYRAIRVEER